MVHQKETFYKIGTPDKVVLVSGAYAVGQWYLNHQMGPNAGLEEVQKAFDLSKKNEKDLRTASAKVKYLKTNEDPSVKVQLLKWEIEAKQSFDVAIRSLIEELEKMVNYLDYLKELPGITVDQEKGFASLCKQLRTLAESDIKTLLPDTEKIFKKARGWNSFETVLQKTGVEAFSASQFFKERVEKTFENLGMIEIMDYTIDTYAYETNGMLRYEALQPALNVLIDTMQETKQHFETGKPRLVVFQNSEHAKVFVAKVVAYCLQYEWDGKKFNHRPEFINFQTKVKEGISSGLDIENSVLLVEDKGVKFVDEVIEKVIKDLSEFPMIVGISA